MLIATDMTSIHPSKETISNRMSKDARNESKLKVVDGAGLSQTRGTGKPKELSTMVFGYSLMQSAIPPACRSLQVFIFPAKMLSPQTAYGIMYRMARTAASRIRTAPEMMRDSKVFRM